MKEESIVDVEQDNLENIDDLVKDNLGQPVDLVAVTDEIQEENSKMFVEVKRFQCWPAFYNKEYNSVVFLNNQIGHPLEVRR